MASNTSTGLQFSVVDAFTSEPFKGNQASVVFLPESTAYDDSMLLSISREFNYQETAYLMQMKSESDIPRYSLRWFTPESEFPLCGHATLASAHTLFTGRHQGADGIRFETMSGTLTARKPDAASSMIELDFPTDETVLRDVDDASLDARVRQAAVESCPAFKSHIRGWAKAGLGWVVELSSKISLPECIIDCRNFLELGGYVVFTQPAPKDAPEDIWSRVFDPVIADNPEDPVTGSAHCILVCYWLGQHAARSRLPAQLASATDLTLLARQVSPRSGTLTVQWNRETGRAKLRGQAVTIMQGVLHV